MEDQVKRVIKSILSADDERATCEPYGSLISAYVEAELAGQDAATLYPQLASHLKTCPDCYEEYQDLRSILLLEQRGELVEPPRPGRFDFSFLEELPSKPPLWKTAEANVRRLTVVVTAQLGAVLATLGSLPEALVPYRRLVPAPVALRIRDIRESRLEDLTEILELPDPAHNIRIKLLMGPVQAGRGTVMIQVEDLERSRPLSRVRVTLRDQEGHLLESVPTASDGTVTFKSLNVGQYTVEIRHGEMRWELGLHLEEARS